MNPVALNPANQPAVDAITLKLAKAKSLAIKAQIAASELAGDIKAYMDTIILPSGQFGYAQTEYDHPLMVQDPTPGAPVPHLVVAIDPQTGNPTKWSWDRPSPETGANAYWFMQVFSALADLQGSQRDIMEMHKALHDRIRDVSCELRVLGDGGGK